MKARKIFYVAVAILFAVILLVAALRSSDIIHKALAKRREARIRKNTADSFVVVHYRFKKSERLRSPDDDFDFNEGEVRENILAKTTRDIVGVIISEKGAIFVPENHLWPDTIDKITITGPDGKQREGTQGRILCKTPAQIIRIVGQLPKRWKPLQFSAGPKVLGMKSKLYGISLTLDEDREGPYDKEGHFSIVRGCPVRKRGNKTNVPDYFSIGFGNQVTVICGAGGSVLGVSVHHRIETGTSPLLWRGADILDAPGLMRIAGEEKVKEQFAKYLYQVKVTFRPPPKEDEEYDMGGMGAFWGQWGGSGDGERELFLYGLAIAPDRLLIPRAMAQELVGGIDTLSVQIGDGYVPAKFSGVLKQCEGTIITLNDARLPEVASIDPQIGLPRAEPFWTVYARELAGKDLVIDFDRWIHKRRGHEGKSYRQVANGVESGSWLLDRQGRLVGLYTNSRRDYQRILPYLNGEGVHGYARSFSVRSFLRGFPGSWGRSPHAVDMNIFDNAAMAAMFRNLAANLDPHIRHLTKEEQKKRAWLGVEFANVSKEMAKQLNLRRQTQDGRIGLIINRVYPKSPAAKIGLVEGDVLLKLNVPEAPWPIELTYGDSPGYEGPDWGDIDVPDEFERMGWRAPRKRPWPSRGNPFTSMLQVIGEGTTVHITFVHDGKEVEKEFVIEQSLPDSLSAKRYKDKKLGFTVKNLTYEVRSALKLSEDENAVVISKIEPGTPAALARISAFELIRAVNGQKISSVDDLESAIKTAKKEGKKSVRITVEWMGKTRLADLKFEVKGGGLKEMLRKFVPVPR